MATRLKYTAHRFAYSESMHRKAIRLVRSRVSHIAADSRPRTRWTTKLEAIPLSADRRTKISLIALSLCASSAWKIPMGGWSSRDGPVAYRQYSTDYVRQERNAANSKRGIWQGEFQVPWEWRRTQPQRPQPKTESLRLPPARPYAVYYRPGDLSGTRYSTLAECNRVRQQAGNVGSCVMK
jgi:hypothetical protein